MRLRRTGPHAVRHQVRPAEDLSRGVSLFSRRFHS